MPSAEWEHAAAVLDGRLQPVIEIAKPAKAPVPDDGYVRVEIKLCERCGRTFTREAGSRERECKYCRPAAKAPKAESAERPRPRHRTTPICPRRGRDAAANRLFRLWRRPAEAGVQG